MFIVARLNNNNKQNKTPQNSLDGNSPVVHCLGLLTSTAGVLGLIPIRGAKIPQVEAKKQTKQKQTQKTSLDVYLMGD